MKKFTLTLISLFLFFFGLSQPALKPVDTLYIPHSISRVQSYYSAVEKSQVNTYFYIDSLGRAVFQYCVNSLYSTSSFVMNSAFSNYFAINCNFAVYNHLLTHPESVRGKYKAILISQATLEKLPEEFLTIDNNILCDKTNKLDRMSFGISSVSVLKIKNKMIVASKSMTMDDVLNGIETFFKEM